jgi:outer membrane protein
VSVSGKTKTCKDMNLRISITLALMALAHSVLAQWSLDSCLHYADKHNAELLSQAQALRSSQQRHQASRARLLPEISGRGDMDHFWRIPVMALPAELIGGTPGTFVAVRTSTPWTASYGADASLGLLDPQAWRALKLSSLELQMQENQLQSFRQLLHRNIRMAYYNVQIEHANREAVRQLWEGYQQIHRLIGLQFEQGLIDQITFNQSQTLLNDRRQADNQAEMRIRQAYLDLKFWMGYPLDEELTVKAEAEMPRQALHSDDFSAERLPEFHLVKLRQAQAEQQYRVARGRLLPTLTGIANYQRVAFRNEFDFLGAGDWFNVGAIGLRLNVPILSIRQMMYEPAQQRALMLQARYDFQRYREGEERRFINERLQLGQAYQSWVLQQENIALAQQNEGLAMRKIKDGIIDMVQLRQIQDDLQNAHQRLNAARLNYLKHYVELQYLQGE